jgi:ribonuclease HII
MKTDLWAHEIEAAKSGFTRIAGIDEAGRGPLAGPVVSAAVILPMDVILPDVNDSKQLTPKKRELLYHQIYASARSIGIGIVDPCEIDRINILQASILAMKIAVENLNPHPEILLIDGNSRIDSTLFQKCIPQGDAKSISIAAASIVAKVSRDRLMDRYHEEFPLYGFMQHKGYPTKAHKSALSRYGCCPIHRITFKGVVHRQCELPLNSLENPAKFKQPHI